MQQCVVFACVAQYDTRASHTLLLWVHQKSVKVALRGTGKCGKTSIVAALLGEGATGSSPPCSAFPGSSPVWLQCRHTKYLHTHNWTASSNLLVACQGVCVAQCWRACSKVQVCNPFCLFTQTLTERRFVAKFEFWDASAVSLATLSYIRNATLSDVDIILHIVSLADVFDGRRLEATVRTPHVSTLSLCRLTSLSLSLL